MATPPPDSRPPWNTPPPGGLAAALKLLAYIAGGFLALLLVGLGLLALTCGGLTL